MPHVSKRGAPPLPDIASPALGYRGAAARRRPRPMTTTAVLYSADAPDQSIALEAAAISGLSERQLLWIDLASPADEEFDAVAALLGCDRRELALEDDAARPSLANFGDWFRVHAKAVSLSRSTDPLVREPMTLIVGRNYVVTVHESGSDFLEQLRTREKGDSTIGVLSAESFAASLLDWLLDTYFRVLEVLVRDIDRVEVLILGRRLPPQNLEILVASRRRIADLRRLLKAHRDVFYGMARPDFIATEQPDSRLHFEALNKHYERAEDDLETARDLVVGSFELVATRVAQKTNDTMRALTFVTVMMGLLALVAGVLGMNFALPLFETGVRGFAVVVGSMVVLTGVAVGIAVRRGWI
jgi:Mg2+ and Co2+ transporter CorA